MKIKGFTLLELCLVMSLFIILSLIGMGSYSFLVQKNEQQTIIDELHTAVHYAKLQAMSLNTPVYLTPLDDSLDWSKGMMLHSFNKKNNKMKQMYQWQWQHPLWNVHWQGVYSKDKIIFSNNPMQAISNGRFTLINNQNLRQVVIILNRLGRLRIKDSA